MTFYEELISLKHSNEIDGDLEYEAQNFASVAKEEPESLKETVAKVAQGSTIDPVSTADEHNKTIVEHSRDASIFHVVPQMVFFPHNRGDIQKVLELAAKFPEEKISISVRAGGTCMSGGSLNTGLILNMTRYMNTFQIDPLEQIATVEMGTMFKAIADEAQESDLMFGAYTSSKDICGIGGMVGNNASGEKSVRFGATIDNVTGLEVILADGTMIRTGTLANTGEPLKSLLKATELKKHLLSIHDGVKDSLTEAIGEVTKAASGYRLERIRLSKGSKDSADIDLTPIFVGAQGTLGIITKAQLKLVPIPAHTRLLVIAVDSLDELPFILKTVMKHNPEGVETFDINTFNRAKVMLKEETDLCQQFFKDSTTLIVLAQFSESSQAVTDATARSCEKALETHPVRVTFVDSVGLQESVWKIRRSSYGVMKYMNAQGRYAVPCIEDIIVPVSKFDTLIPALQLLLSKHNIEYGFHGHIGDGSIRIIPIFDFSKPGDETANTIIDFTREVIELVKSLKGNMSADHSDGIIRTPFLREFYGEEVFAAFVKVKLLFDPKGVLNRGKKIGGTEDMIRKFIIKE